MALHVPGAVRRLFARCDSAIVTSNRALWLATFLPLLALYAWTMRTTMLDMSPDPVAVAPSAWAVAHLGTPVLPRGYWLAGNPWDVAFAHGQVVSNRSPGFVVIAAPFYWLFGSASPWDQYPASVAAAFVTSAAMATLAVVVAKIAPARVALATALIAGTATTTWAVSGTALWPHGPDQLLVAAAMASLATGCAAVARRSVRPVLTSSRPAKACSPVHRSYSCCYRACPAPGAEPPVGPAHRPLGACCTYSSY